jgi:hypothetical protein
MEFGNRWGTVKSMKYDNILFFGFGLLFVSVYILITYIIQHNTPIEKETLDYNDIEKTFFEKIKEGNLPYKLLSIYTPFDLMMIKSFFISENIPYYIEFEHLMNLKPFVHSLNYNNVNFYILKEDYDDAIIIIDSYIESKNLNEYKAKSVLRGVFEAICISWVMPSPKNHLGLDVNYNNLLSDEETSEDIDLIEIGEYQENNDIEINMDGEDYKDNEIWVCSMCGTSNEIYLINCKKCGKNID